MDSSEGGGPVAGGERAGSTAPEEADPGSSVPRTLPGTPAVPLGPVTDTGPVTDEGLRGAGPTREVPLTPPTPTEPGPSASPVSRAPFLPPHWQEQPVAGPTAESPGVGSTWGTAASTWSTSASPDPVSASVVPVWGPLVPPLPVAERVEPSGRRSPGWLWVIVSAAAALVGALVGGGIVAATNHDNGSTTVKEISAGPALLNGTTNIETVIAKVLPAIVSIDATSPEPASQSLLGGTSTGGEQEDQGTGMIITSNGEVVTNNHVISGATTITVTLYGSLKALPATLIDTDPTNDVALLQINNQSNLPTVSYGDSDNVQVGDAVVAIGNALGLSAGTPTVTQGIISAKGRTVQASDSSGDNTETLSNMFQTDAAINPGNSGGPLVDSSGTVIGMNTAVASSEDGTAQAQNIGFAIPSNKIEQLLPELRKKEISNSSQDGSGFLGVEIETLTSQLRSAYNFVPTQGAVVLEVEPGSPADVAGLQEGDVITSLDGKAITSADQLGTAIQADKPGQSVKIGLYRGQAQMTVTATLASTAEQQQSGG
jgi:S1-C subfamily serine protease